MEFLALTAARADELAAELVSLEERVHAELGARYAEEAWARSNFLLPRPGKWELSCIARDAGCLCGFWIASRPVPEVAHVHRVAVHPAARSRGLGRGLFDCFRARAAALAITRFTLMVAADNADAQRFYQRLGFAPLTGAALAEFAQDHGLPLAGDGLQGHGAVQQAWARDGWS